MPEVRVFSNKSIWHNLHSQYFYAYVCKLLGQCILLVGTEGYQEMGPIKVFMIRAPRLSCNPIIYSVCGHYSLLPPSPQSYFLNRSSLPISFYLSVPCPPICLGYPFSTLCLYMYKWVDIYTSLDLSI